MHSLLYDIISVIISSLTLTGVFFILYRMEKQNYLLLWCLSYLFFSLSFINAISIELGVSGALTRHISLIIEIFSGIFIFYGTNKFVFGRQLRRSHLTILFSFMAFYLVIMPFENAMTEVIVVHIFVGCTQLYSGTMLLRYVKGFGGKTAGLSLTVWGLHRFNFILTLFVPALSVLGYQITLFLILSTSLGIVMMHFERVKNELSKMDYIVKKATESSKDIVFHIRLRPEIVLEYASPSVETILGYKPEELLKSDAHLHTLINAENVQLLLENTDEQGFYQHIYAILSKDGRTVKLEISTTVIRGVDGQADSLIGIARDITESSKAFDMLADTKKWYEGIFKSAKTMVMLVDRSELVISDCNDELKAYYCMDENPKGLSFRSVFADTGEFEDYLDSLGSAGEFSCRHLLSDGNILHVSLYTNIIQIGEKEFLYVTVFDNSGRFYLADELSRVRNLHKSILESLNEGVVGINNSGEVFFINDSALNMLGYDSEDILYKNHHEVIHDKNHTINTCPEDCEILSALKSGQSIRKHDDFFVKKDGSLMPIRYNFSKLKETSDAGILVFRDMTEDIAKENTIMRSLEQNNLLMHELHHRIKNNFQIISSLLSIHADELADEPERQFLFESISKIHSLALIHEMLYQSESFAHIMTRSYFESLIEDMKSVFHREQKQINVTMDISDVKLHMDEAVPCALIINELYTNAVKHAENESGIVEIGIKFMQSDNERILIFSDNGNLTKVPDVEEIRDSYGLMIIHSLVHQLKGEISFSIENGLKAEIRYVAFRDQEAV